MLGNFLACRVYWDCSFGIVLDVCFGMLRTFLIVSQFNSVWLCVAGIMSDEIASTDALRRDGPVVEQSIPGEAVARGFSG